MRSSSGRNAGVSIKAVMAEICKAGVCLARLASPANNFRRVYAARTGCHVPAMFHVFSMSAAHSTMVTQQSFPANPAPWWRGAVIYQIYPRSFLDSNGDGIGDLPGITSKLEYVASLGVDAIWLSPFFKSPMKDFGYDVSDYRDVDPIFGSLKDFDALVVEAHRLDLRVIIDQVYAHTSDAHPWFQESRVDRSNDKR